MQISLLFLTIFALTATVYSHVVISYPGWRGNNLVLNGSVEDTSGLGVGVFDGTWVYPYGMQWIYPCGGMPVTTNRTNWPVTGGAVALQPGWFSGHKNALIYVNMGFGSIPANYSVPLARGFEIEGPTDGPYPGTICLPYLPIPEGFEVKVGDHATIQIIEAATHGASQYSCVDITFAEPSDVAEVNVNNCFNTTSIRFVSSKMSGTNNTSEPTTTRDLFSSTAPSAEVNVTNPPASGAWRHLYGGGVMSVSVFVFFLGMLL
ncbi:hypothetical protein F4778DRAFT_186325 [Xylariomycetidae sp. FL2044]|nr:hypothetical protein F4778DRAFT_186325 [Xylariomycetidae sp. FL2044]